jgi:hypothetical protein
MELAPTSLGYEILTALQVWFAADQASASVSRAGATSANW